MLKCFQGDDMNLENVKVALDSNSNLNDEIRDNFYSLVHIFHKFYPTFDLTNLCNHLKTLKIEKSNKYLNKKVSKYNPITNVLEFNIEKIEEGYDMKYILMYELLHIITNNGSYYGFNKNDELRALDAGYTAILANNLIGNDSNIPYLENEIISTNMIALIIGSEQIEKTYFENNYDEIKQLLQNEGVNLS